MSKPPVILTPEQVRETDEVCVRHPLNPESLMYYRPLSEQAGFEHGGLHMVRVPAGHESNELHSHEVQEEFYFVLSGRARMLVGDDAHDLDAGGFAAFPAGSAAHMITNPFDEDLVYLVGGSRTAFEMGEFPRHGKTFVHTGGKMRIIDTDQLEDPGWTFTDDE